MSSLDPYPLVAYTLLDAVNLCLRAMGSGAVQALDSTSLTPDSETALKTVHDVSINLQQEGWQWNTEKAMVLDPWPQDGSAAAGTIRLPDNLLKVVAIKHPEGTNLVQRGRYLYDPFKSTSNIGVSVTVRIVVALDYEDQPQAARHYIAVRAARVLGQSKLNNVISNKFNEQEEIVALVRLYEAEDQDDDLTWMEKNQTLGSHARRRRRT